MSTKSRKFAKRKEEVVEENIEELTAKELYDKKKEEKLKEKEKKNKKTKKSSRKKIVKKINTTNLGARIFAVFMLVLMIASVIVSIATYLFQ